MIFAAAGGWSAVSVLAVPAGTITKLDTVPNYFFDQFGDRTYTRQTGAFADPVSGNFFEYNSFYCPSLVRMDLGSNSVAATSDRGTQHCTNDPSLQAYGNGGPQPNVAIDSRDQLLIGIDQSGQLVAAREDNLNRVAQWTLAAPATHVRFVSWYAPDDEVIVLSDNSNDPVLSVVAPAVYVTALSMPLSLQANKPVALWSATVPGCQATLFSTFAGAAAYHAGLEPAMYVPCIIESLSRRAGVAKMTLGSTQAGGGACATPATECWGGQSTVTALPQPVNDVIFDPGSDRLFMPTQVSAIVYDGHEGVLEGRTAIGTSSDGNAIALGLDAGTGRIYSMSKGDGLMVIEARRTPVAPGYKFLQYGSKPFVNTFPVMAPDQAHPYTRLIIPHPDPDKSTQVPVDFQVFADTLPIGVDPPASAVDSNTVNGAIPDGAQVSKVFSGTARGFGYHSDYVGGVSAALINQGTDPSLVSSVPFASTNDVLAAAVHRLTFGIGSREGAASAFADAGGNVSYDYGQCTGAQSLAACVPVPCPVTSCAPPSGAPSPPATSQRWPYPDALCYQPGGDTQRSNSVAGTYVTDTSGGEKTTGNPDAAASVDCSLDASVVKGTTVMRGSSTRDSAGSLPPVTFGDATTTSTVTNSTDAGIVSETTSEVHGVHIGLSSAAIEIGAAVHHARVAAAGKPGTARVLDQTATVSNIIVAGQELCSAQCTDSDFDRLNKQFPTEIYVFRPTPDNRYDDPTSHLGSPGGYIAVVQANLSQQYGDQQFNAMSTEESTYLPALRIILYGHSEGNPQINRQILDLAGVEDDAEYGIQLTAGGTDYQPISIQNAARQAGVPSGPVLQLAHTNPPSPANLQDLIRKTITQLVEGILWLARNPAQALEMGIFLAVLGLPLAMTRRRWTWPGTTREQIA